jgi:hypothetical protein
LGEGAGEGDGDAQAGEAARAEGEVEVVDLGRVVVGKPALVAAEFVDGGEEFDGVAGGGGEVDFGEELRAKGGGDGAVAAAGFESECAWGWPCCKIR